MCAQGRESDGISPSNRSSAPPAARPTASRRLRRAALRIAIIGVSTYVAVCIGVAVFQTQLIYFPTKGIDQSPADVGLRFEDVQLTTADGTKIHAWYVANADPAGCILFCHGNAGNMADRLHILKLLYYTGQDVLLFDYRGFGKSRGTPSERGTYEDADAAWRFLTETKGWPGEKIVLLGRSLGGGVAVELARRHRPAALIIDSSFSSLADVGAIHYPLLPVRWILRHRYDSIDKIGAINCPMLFFHSEYDTLIPIRLARKLFDAANDPKRFVETPGTHVTAGFDFAPQYTEILTRFVQDGLAQKVQ